MKLSLIMALSGVSAEHYNILAMDGGGIRGLIPSVVLQNMEKYAYEYATSKGYDFPKYPGRENVVAMKDLFEMTAGTSTGSILAAGLVYPDKDHMDIKMPAFFADDLLKIYSERGGEIFVKKQLGWWDSFFWFILITSIFGCIFYYIGML